jgi:hypothetical protein
MTLVKMSVEMEFNNQDLTILLHRLHCGKSLEEFAGGVMVPSMNLSLFLALRAILIARLHV